MGFFGGGGIQTDEDVDKFPVIRLWIDENGHLVVEYDDGD